MADFTLVPADGARVEASAPNFTTGKTAAAASNNYYIPNNGRVILICAAGTSATITVETPNTSDGLAVADLTVALGNTNVRAIGPFPQGIYNDAQGRIKVTVSAACDIYAVRV